MKKLMLLFILIGSFNKGFSVSIPFKTSEIKNLSIPISDDPIGDIKNVVQEHLDGSATRDISKMSSVLHDDFRIVVNDAKKGVTVLDRATMLNFYKQKKFGGEVKLIEFISIDVQGNLSAIVKVKETGKKAIFNLYFSLINTNGNWKIINELAYLDYLK
ncbi:nuclear transport factor 2 family protein [Aquimarina algiphila]|uniref:Nuclear transport factor 2 family protein n=1 Tax=Aquimarina algiphila TaxID=2047982 RepID=A0A554VHN2_9FLAO|nr:nuclear transport factor 2 family protein [Aquimarina algiphila]TSE06991.1 nuclear transport factor 2 family protein [Aquimarina algiphila]